MSALTVTLGADISALKQSMASATQLVSASAKKMASLSAAGLKIGLGAALAGGGVALAAGIKAVTSAADFEQTKVAFTTLIGDAGKAEQTLAQLRELGAKTPFEFPELADAGRKLIAFGEGSDTVAATLARIGDVSAGVQAPVNEIAELYGKARVQGRLFAEDINQLTGRGIPIIGELAKQFGVSDSEVKKLVESGQVGFPQIEQAFVNMTSQGGKFSGMMEAQSKTTNGLFSTLKDTINEVFLTLGTPINDAIRPLVEQAIALAQKLAPLATEAGAKIRDAIQYVIAVFRSGEFLNLVGTALKLGFALSVNFLWASLRATIAAAGQYVVEILKTAVTYFQVLTTADFWKGMGNALIGIFLSAIVNYKRQI
jgi:tape measure domain-containing protein